MAHLAIGAMLHTKSGSTVPLQCSPASIVSAMLHTKSGSTDGAEPSSDGDREVLTHD